MARPEQSSEIGADRIGWTCRLCPRQCGADRYAGRIGACGAGSTVRMYRYGLHHGEEPPISGSRGSGTLFFSHCTMSCLYCQNWPWSQDNRGEDIDTDALAERFRKLRLDGAHNLNLVSPTPWLPMIRDALAKAHTDRDRLPVVMNTSGYESVETLREFKGVADVYLTDLRYARSATARDASNAPDYVETARAALLEMRRQTGPLQTDEHGIARSGTICRLLVLPGHADETVDNLHWLASHVGTDCPVSVMAQYRPAWRAAERSDNWSRTLRRTEYDRVCEAVATLGLDGWIQDFEADTAAPMAGFNMPAGYGHVNPPPA